jgi:hypothetical protein
MLPMLAYLNLTLTIYMIHYYYALYILIILCIREVLIYCLMVHYKIDVAWCTQCITTLFR